MGIGAGERSPQSKGPFGRLSSMKTRSVELPRRQRSSSIPSITPQSSTGTQGINPNHPPAQSQGQTSFGRSQSGQVQPDVAQTYASQSSGGIGQSSGGIGQSSGGIGQNSSGLLQSNSGGWSGVGVSRPSQPGTPPQQQGYADGFGQEQVGQHLLIHYLTVFKDGRLSNN